MRLVFVCFLVTALFAWAGCASEGDDSPAAGPAFRAVLVSDLHSPLVAGTALGPVEIRVEDASGHPIEGGTYEVEIELTGARRADGLAGTTVRTTSHGRVIFDDLVVEAAGTDLRLVAQIEGLVPATSTTFTVSPAAPASLAFVRSPAAATAGSVLAPVEVAVHDAYGNAVEGRHSITVSLGSGAELLGTTTLETSGTSATFADLSVRTAAAGNTLVARADGLQEAVSDPFDVVPAYGVLTFSAAPGDAIAGQPLAPAPRVLLRDGYGNPILSSIEVTIEASGPDGVTLDGQSTVTAVDGVAVFSDVRIDTATDSVVLRARATGFADGISAPIRVSPGTPDASASSLRILPAAGIAGGEDYLTVELALRDELGNPIAGANVALEAEGGTPALRPESGVTGPDGRFVATLASAIAAPITVSAAAEGVALDAMATFFDPPALADLQIGDEAGCLPISFQLVQQQHQPVDVLVEWSLDGETFFPATILGTTTGLVTGPAPGSQQLVYWDALADLPVPAGEAIVRITPHFLGADAAPTELLLPFDFRLRLVAAGSVGTTAALTAPAAGDFDGDGRPDVVAGARDASNGYYLLFFHTRADGTFAQPTATSLPPDSYALSITPLDYDGDGLLDVVIATQPAVLILPGNGDGTFGTPISGTVGDILADAAAGDFNGDGLIDFATARYPGAGGLDGTAALLLADGAGGFSASAATVVGSLPASGGVAVGDLDADGNLDFTVGSIFSHNVSVLYGNGDGTIDATGEITLGVQAFGVEIVDLDADGHLDLVVGTAGDGSIRVIRGAGGRAFAEPERLETGTHTRFPLIVDLDGDGRLDITGPSLAGAGDLPLLLANPDGGFSLSHWATGAGSSGAAAADFDGDGRIDIAYTHQYALGVMHNEPALGCMP